MKQIILVVGPIGAGKSTLAGHLGAKGWRALSVGAVLKELYVKAHGGVPTRRQLQKTGTDLISTRGERYFAELILPKVHGNTRTVIEGVRTLGIALALRSLVPDLYIVYVDAPQATRLLRVISRDGIDAGEFYELESLPIEFQVADIKSIADLKIDNSGPIEIAASQLHQAINGI